MDFILIIYGVGGGGLVLGGEIWFIYGLYMIGIVPMYQLDMIWVLFLQGSEGVQSSQNCLNIKNPTFSMKIMDFFHFL